MDENKTLPKFAVLQLSGCAGCEVSLINADIPPSFKHSTLFIDGVDTTVTVKNHSNDSDSLSVFEKP